MTRDYQEEQKQTAGFKANYNDTVDKLANREAYITELKQKVALLEERIMEVNNNLLEATKLTSKFEADYEALNEKLENSDAHAKTRIADLQAVISEKNTALALKEKQLNQRQLEIDSAQKQNTEIGKRNAELIANNNALADKLASQKVEIEELRESFNKEFKLIANKIVAEQTQSFTHANKENLKAILSPLGDNLEGFKNKINEVYDKEAKERFSLANEVKKMADLNKVISDEARNLTNALKSEAKTQGNWGEMILESILEKSGLRKDEEYFMEYQLTDDDGKALRSDSEGKKMRPDAVIKYPDNRNVIIDSKVSLNAFSRYLAATDADEQATELKQHVNAIKNHIVSLSTKGYDDYDKALDFVMMFVPSEPAYIAAMQGDANLWNFAYEKRILLMNPTNLITSLKLIVDLWKREYQNLNAQLIADRGAKLYDKFVGFVANLDRVGEYIGKAQGRYDEAYKQLSTGNDNLVLQTTKLKDLGVKNKKSLSPEMENTARLSSAEE